MFNLLTYQKLNYWNPYIIDGLSFTVCDAVFIMLYKIVDNAKINKTQILVIMLLLGDYL